MKGSDIFLLGLAFWGFYEMGKRDSRGPNTPMVADYDFNKIWDEAIKKAFRKPEPITTNTIEIPLLQRPTALIKTPDNTAIEASKWLAIIKHPSVIAILGKRGSGKSSLAFRVAEYFRWTAPVYVVGLPAGTHRYLPDWVGAKPELKDVPPDSIVIVDESYILYHARSSMTAHAKALSEMLNLSRQRNQTLIFVSQESRQIDRNILSAADVVIFKEPGMLQHCFDRPELRDIAKDAKLAFETVKGDKRKWGYVYAPNADYIGLMENGVPAFWNQKLSRAFAYDTGRPLVKSPRETNLENKISKAKELHTSGWSITRIKEYFGVSRGTVYNWLHDYPYKND